MALKLYFSFFVLFFFLFCFSSFSIAQATKSLDVVINEIAWLGTNVSANDEWIELYNNTQNNINLDGWVLKSEDGAPEIKLTGIISARGFFLLERTDDETVPGVAASQIYKGALGNNGENLKLFDGSGNLIDEVNCSSGWFGGDNKTKQTMERKNPQASGDIAENWQTSQNPGGTAKAKNSIVLPEMKKLAENGSPLTKSTDNKPIEAGPLLIYPGGIVFNEIIPSPEGSDEKEEWIELFNQNNFEVNLSDWEIKDVSGKIITYVFPKETKIPPQGFLVLSRPTTKITLNNDEDGLILTSPDGNIIDKINYKKAPQGESFNRVNSDWLWSANLTPGADNATEKTENRSLEDKSLLETKEKEGLATIGGQFPKSSKFLFALLIAISLAISSGVAILILKRKIRKERLF